MDDKQRNNRFDTNPKKAGILILLLCLGFLEIIARIGVGIGWLPYLTYATSRQPQYWVDIDRIVGRWRYPDKSVHIKTNCIDINYQTNSVGARDRERSVRSTAENRVVVLGDSFAEGLGVPVDDRITNILESTTGIEHLNFGTASWGTIQEWQYYKNHAQTYDHSAVFVLALPENDFTDNNPDSRNHNWYRPYLRRTEDAYEIFYTVEFDQRITGERTTFKAIKNTIDNNIYLANVLRQAVRLFKDSTIKPFTEPSTDYDNFSTGDIDLFKYVLGEIAGLAGQRPVYVITIPTERDFSFARTNGADFQLIRELKSFADQTDNVRIIDLLPYFLADADKFGRTYADYTLKCDQHWGSLGNRVAADAILNVVYGMPGHND